MEKIVLVRKFKAPVYREFSYTSKIEKFGMTDCEFTLVIHKGGETGGLICEYGNIGCQDLNLWFNSNKTLTDFDGAWRLPKEGIEMIKEIKQHGLFPEEDN